MPEYIPSAETHTPNAPDQLPILSDSSSVDPYLTPYDYDSGKFRPDTPAEAEQRAKALAAARLDFKLAWDLHTAELAPQPPRIAEVIPIAKPRPALMHFTGKLLLHRRAG